MANYRYKAVDGAGKTVEGVLAAESQGAVVSQLKAAGLVPIRADPDRAARWGRLLSLEIGGSRTRQGGGALALFTRQLAMLLASGLPLERALITAQGLVHRRLQAPLAVLLEKVRGGAAFSEALAAAGGFPGFYRGMVEAGEASGHLEAVLQRLADYLEHQARFRETLKSALVYPLVVALTCVASLALFVAYVLPQFEAILLDAHAEIPQSTRLLLALARGAEADWWIILLVLAVGTLALRRALARPASRAAFDRLLLAVPVTGALIRKGVTAQFARTLGLLLENGVALPAALGIARNTVANGVMLRALDRVAAAVRAGEGFADPLKLTAVLPPVAAQLIKAGEESAHLPEMLAKVADIYDWEVRQGLERLLALMVPALTVVMGVVIAFVVGAILTAMYSVYDVAT